MHYLSLNKLYLQTANSLKLNLELLDSANLAFLDSIGIDYELELNGKQPYIVIFRHPSADEPQGDWFEKNYGSFSDEQAATVIAIFSQLFAQANLKLQFSASGSATTNGRQCIMCFDIVPLNAEI